MLDYDAEAGDYDRTRGGEARAAAAAEAVERLLPPGVRTVVDVGGGTGIVSARLRRPGRRVVVVDRSAGMLASAVSRLPGGAVRGDATRLPLRPGCADAVVVIWLLHLLPDAAPALAALPEQDRRRPDPVYRLVAFRRTTSTAPTGR